MTRDINNRVSTGMFAVIETGGKQYKVSPGQKLEIEKLDSGAGLPLRAGEKVEFDKVLLVVDKDVRVGAPFVRDAKVEGKVLKNGRSDKKIVFRYHSKTRYRKFKTHRQPYTEVEITKI